jgi:hypothetical protein
VGSKEGRTWIVNAFVFFLPILILWILAVLWIGSSLSAQVNFLTDIRTSLFADYSPDSFNQSFKSLKLAIFGDVLSDSEQAANELSGLQSAMQGLVPSATLEAGSSIWTIMQESTPTYNPTFTAEPSDTLIPTSTPERIQEKSPTPSQISTATATKFIPTATPVREKVSPLLECVQDNEDGTITAFFGYKNHSSFLVEIPIGELNKMKPGPLDRGQPTEFDPGRSSQYPNASFQVVFQGESITWYLDGESVTASGISNHCDPIVPEQVDDDPPLLSGGDPNPPPGNLEMCSVTIKVNDLRVVDPAVSSGMAWVKLKYNVEGYTTEYIYSDPLTLCSGGWTDEKGWEGCYSGSILVAIAPEWIPPDASTMFMVNLYVKALDNGGNDSYYYLGQYSMPACCGKCE